MGKVIGIDVTATNIHHTLVVGDWGFSHLEGGIRRAMEMRHVSPESILLFQSITTRICNICNRSGNSYNSILWLIIEGISIAISFGQKIQGHHVDG